MKFYYNGKLVRTSKTHEYKYGVYHTNLDKVIACSATKDGAQAHIDAKVANLNREIENCENALKAIAKGKTHYGYKDGRKTYLEKVSTAEKHTEWLAGYKKSLESVKRTHKVVELEAR